MHHLKKKSALEKFTPLAEQMSPEELLQAILADDKGYSEEEANEIIAALDPKAPPAPKKEEPKEEQFKVPTQSETLGLDRFNYSNLTEKSFEEYEALLRHLPAHKQFDFERVKAKALRKELYPGLPQSPIVMYGVKVESTSPDHVTRMEARHALELNRQVGNSGLYYLLKK